MAAAHAAEAGSGAVQKIGHGEINWTDQYVVATGSGAPPPGAVNVAQARLAAERAAKMDAFRNILEVLKGAQVTAKSTGADEMSNGTIKSKVEGVIKNFKVVDTKYYSDGSVDVIVRVELKGDLSDALVPDAAKPVAVPAAGAAKNSGLIVNAKGLQAVPAMAPRIVDEAGNEIYGVNVVTEAAAKESGIAGYVKDLDSAQGHSRVKGTPVVVRAIRLATPGKSDLVISNADAEKLKDPNSNQSYLAQGKVIIVID
ncbi:MAG: LPP20 family lipoprotein [Deltaproteobacteria bacterium]|nr:LPP20 family lipoprotein [Deltaproteobacteria bacterium]